MGADALMRLLPLLLLGCAAAPLQGAALSVGDVWQKHHELEGRLVRVHGVITRCEPLGCMLRESRDGSKWLGVGESENFDDHAARYLGKPIVVEGRLRSDCLHAYADPPEVTQPHGEFQGVICTDRSGMLLNPRLIGPTH
jgi:hypothetical protein